MKTVRLLALLLVLTTPAFSAPITTYTYAFGRPMLGTDSTFVANGNPACNSWVPLLSIVNATSISWYMLASAPGFNCSVTIYNDVGTTIITTTHSQPCGSSGPGLLNVTGLAPFTLAAGTKYQVCVCGDLGLHILAVDDGAIGGGAQMRNQLSVPLSFTTSTACTVGTMEPPVPLGTFGGGNFHVPIVLIGTDNP